MSLAHLAADPTEQLPASALVADLLIGATPEPWSRLSDEPRLVIMVAPTPSWVRPLRRGLQRLLGSTAVEIHGLETAPRAEPPPDYETAIALSRGTSSVIVTGMESWVPRGLRLCADERLHLPPIGWRHVGPAIAAFCGADPDLPDEPLGPLGADAIDAAIRRGATPEACVRRLQAACAGMSATRTVTALPLEVLPAEVRLFGEQLAREVGRYRRGEIQLSDLPRGVLFVGPPGCGKSTAVEAIASATGLPLIAASAGAWMAPGHLGDCIRAMQSTFLEARAIRPSLVFADEIDAMVDPGAETGQSRSWWMQFRAALLSTIDGVATEPGIIFCGACNHEHLVDRALLRSGRLDRRIEIGVPDAERIRAILSHHLGGDAGSVDVASLAALATGATPADLARAVREARADARDRGERVTTDDLVRAIAPAETRAGEVVRATAVHEAGHAVAAIVLGERVDFVSIVSDERGSGGRARIGAPQMLDRAAVDRTVAVGLGGRAADLVVSGRLLGHAAGDLAQVTQLLVDAHARWGLGDALVSYADSQSAHHALLVDAQLRARVEADLARIWSAAVQLARANRDLIETLADVLVRRRVLSGTEVLRIVSGNERRGERIEPA